MKNALIRLLKAADVEFVRILWCDNANIIRGKSIHIDALDSHFEHGVGISTAQQSVPVMYDGISPGSGLAPVGEVRLVPDWESVNVPPYSPGHARVMGDMRRLGKPWPYCPREFLRRMIKKAEEKGVNFLASFENEFYLLKSGAVEPVDKTHFAATFSKDANRDVISEIVWALTEQGMKMQQHYPEAGPGQHEVTIGCDAPLQAADNQVAFRETVRAVAHNEGLQASFLPKIFPDKSGNGCHLHLSLWKDGKNIFTDEKGKNGISKTGACFIGGLLEHLPALMAVTTPTVNSFRRIRPRFWCGAFRCWGIDNREAAVRVLTGPGTGVPDHLEFKTLDAAANPYLALGCVIAAGLDGVERKLPLGDPVQMDPADMPEEDRIAAGVDALPTDLGDSIEMLSRDEVLLEALGDKMATAYLAVKRNEYKYIKDMEMAEEVRLLIDKY